VDARRVVTGHNSSGRSVFVSDELVFPLTVEMLPGSEFHALWGADSVLTFPCDGSRPVAKRFYPPVGGFRCGYFTIPPVGQKIKRTIGVEAAFAELGEKLPGMADYLESDHPGMHTTATIDFGIILSGEATLELDDGAKVTLAATDTFVQNGTRHRWSNTGAVPAVVAVVSVGVNHRHVN
jgi:mannose-6-phosphate isomerase-like protein (cupin superfamily)